MSYQTYFSDGSNPQMTNEHMAKLAEIAGYEIQFDESMKWYEWKEHMAELSIHFPTTHFVLKGEGESGDDHWEAHFINGTFCKLDGQIVYPPYADDKMEMVKEPLPPPKAHGEAVLEFTKDFKVGSDTAIDFDF